MTRIFATRNWNVARPHAAALAAAVGAVALLGGCSSGTHTPSGSPLPPAPPASNATAYIGSQAPGYWTFNVDDTQNVFSYQAQTGSAAAVSGGVANDNGVLDLGNSNGTSLGLAVETPGVGALLRPGGTATLPVVMVQQSDCLPISGRLRYIYAVLPGATPQQGSNVSSTGFGTFTVGTSADGKSWSFEDVHNYVVTNLQGGPLAADTENGRDPELFSASCTSSGGVGTVAADPKAAFPSDTPGGDPVAPTFRFNAAGAFVEDRATSVDGASIGFAMPTAAVKPSAVSAAGNYRGFFSESTDKITVDTEAVAFAQATDGTTDLAGGTFPGGVLTQAPGSQYTISLGKQDATYNGVFPNARFIAADPSGLCSSVALNDPTVRSSFDINGNIICTAAGVGVVGQVNGKYVVYFTSHDGTMSTSNQSFLIQFYLYQQ